jgi:hypothetical protein
MDEVHAGQVRRVEIEDQGVIFSESTRRGPFRAEFGRVRDAQLPDELRALGVEVRLSEVVSRDLTRLDHYASGRNHSGDGPEMASISMTND